MLYSGFENISTHTNKKLQTLSLAPEVNDSKVNSLAASTLDKEMVDILTSLAEESSQPGSQKPALSQSILLDQGKTINRSLDHYKVHVTVNIV